MENNNYTKGIYTLLFILTVIACLFVMQILHSFILPVLFAIFLSFVFLPIVTKITKKTKLPWVLVSIFILIVVLILISFITSLLSIGCSAIIAEYPKYQEKFKNIVFEFLAVLPINYDHSKTMFENFESMINIPGLIQKVAVPLSNGVLTFVKSLFVVLLLSLILLIEAKDTMEKIKIVFTNKNKTSVLDMSRTIVSEVVSYISIKFFVSFGTGVLVYIGCLIIGLKFPIIWAFLAFIMNFIPTFGSIISVILTTVFSIMQFAPEWGKVAFVLVFMTLTNFMIGNIIEPKIEGDNLGLSTFVIIVCILFWGWIWGFLGMILAVPLTVIIKIICENIQFLHPIAIFLSNDANKATTKLKN